MIITISGTAGSGKSTIAKMVAKHYGLNHYSMGDLQREMAQERGLTISEWGELEKKDPKYDHMVDEKQKEIGKNSDVIMDSWLAAKFIPHALKIFIDADLDVRVKRRLAQKRDTESFEGPEEAKKDIIEREKINRERWIEFYDFDWTDMSNYDIVIDTTKLDIDGVFKKIIEEIEKFKNH